MYSDSFLLGYLVVLALIGAGFGAIFTRRNKRKERERQLDDAAVLPSNNLGPRTPKLKFSAFELEPNVMYRVVTRFVDHDKDVHEVGERWRFLRKAFLPYEDGLSLFVEQGGQKIHIRMQCREEEQGPVVDAFSDYVIEELN